MRIITQETLAKPIVERVKNLILRKLNLKVRDELIFIDKNVFLQLILKDIIILAIADTDIEKALKIALSENSAYRDNPDIRKNELAEAAEEFKIEVLAFSDFLNNLEENMDDEDIYDCVLSILNSEDELLHGKILEVIRPKIESFFQPVLIEFGEDDYQSVVHNSLYYVQTIALTDSLEEAAEETFFSAEEESIARGITLESTLELLQDCNKKYEEEIKAYKLALNMHYQNAEIPVSFNVFKNALAIYD
ncbi:hypothetical protein [Chryseobacterium mulctrae]|uniref:hypothetical protein n=1 Tax=Chryseobacterium mulctrae TaxID=2576777 RepID=UPI0011164261|nr:hypothetical protein [Chryseobacterium mulctrae]